MTIDVAWAAIPHHICGPPGVLVEHGDHLQPAYKGLSLSQLILSYHPEQFRNYQRRAQQAPFGRRSF